MVSEYDVSMTRRHSCGRADTDEGVGELYAAIIGPAVISLILYAFLPDARTDTSIVGRKLELLKHDLIAVLL